MRSLVAPNDTFTVALLRRWRGAIYLLLLIIAVACALLAGRTPPMPSEPAPPSTYAD